MVDHPFLKEMRSERMNLYVVMEVVETVQEVTLERASKADGCFSLPIFAPLGLQVWFTHIHTLTFSLPSVAALTLPDQSLCPSTEKDPLLPPALQHPDPSWPETNPLSGQWCSVGHSPVAGATGSYQGRGNS